MKKILITGANSYIGISFERYIKDNYNCVYSIDTIDMINPNWRNKSFSGYDAVFHVAGIAHSESGKISDEKARLYYSVNTDLTKETAKKAKSDGVSQFVFMSSAIVYGASAPIGKSKIITEATPVNPENCYGDSKVQAEKGILPLQDDTFKVVILRPPMIYGHGCKGNYSLLSKIAKKTLVFPYINNSRSMIYIENFCEFVRLVIDNEEQGIFHPQNNEYSNTSEIVVLIGNAQGKKVRLVKGLAWLLRALSHISGLVNKAFGNLSYSKELSVYKTDYCKYSLEQSIKKTESHSI